ncbi:MAG: biotin--[acetyl-CoA-carboxylase] ligase [Bacteroidales bacterium]|nr:biotin--[acetyl-CoA-carboxylase] ligase [Bacteroidales bacterium]
MKNPDITFKLQNYETLDSTNCFALELLKKDNPAEGTVIMAGFQKKGKGQRDNSWQSDKNSNITLSIILYPDFLEPEKQFYLSMALSLAVTELLDEYKIPVSIKWPNDIFAGKKKIAGMLIENAILGKQIIHSVLGLGLNVNQERFSADIPNPTSMVIETGNQFAITNVTERLLNIFKKWVKRLYNQEYKYIKEKYEQKLLFINTPSLFKRGDRVFKATIQGINENGQILVAGENKNLLTFNFKEIEYCF